MGEGSIGQIFLESLPALIFKVDDHDSYGEVLLPAPTQAVLYPSCLYLPINPLSKHSLQIAFEGQILGQFLLVDLRDGEGYFLLEIDLLFDGVSLVKGEA